MRTQDSKLKTQEPETGRELSAVGLRGVTVSFQEAVGLEDVTLDIPDGAFVAVVGPNGSGKTTLLRTILGLVKPTQGAVTVLGTSPDKARTRIGYVPQRRPFEPGFPATVFDVALMGTYGSLGILRYPTQAERGRTMGTLEAVGLAERASHVAGHLSGGLQQRLLIARALVQRPRLLLLDEPTAGVDVATQQDIIRLVRDLHAKLRLTTLLVTHDINEVMPCVDRVLYLNRRVYAYGSCSEVLNQSLLERLYGGPVVILERDGRPYVIVSDRH